ncbi:MAG: hypothetical protein KTR22_08720 [Flavobacteriaceae bacterium]|nr:hypothetical protein [Flavobacteriaceae bacterium]
MGTKSLVNYKVKFTIGAFIITLLFILWEYMNGGVITHHLLAREDLPGISNWWGLLTVSLLTWLVVTFIQRRRRQTEKDEESDDNLIKRFLGGLIFGMVVSLLWELDLEAVLPFFILLPVLLSFFTRVHFPESLLGFVIAMIYSFGGILPILIGLVLLLLSFIVYTLIRFIKSLVVSK